MSRWVITTILVTACLFGYAELPERPEVGFFLDEKPVKLTLVTDLIALRNDKSEDPTYIKGMLLHHLGTRQFEAFNIKVKARGNTRRLSDLCDFPPLKLNFKKSEVRNTTFAGIDKVKFVSQCREEEAFQEYLLEEYMLYKTFNLLTENSYRVRLVEIQIKDSQLRTETIEMTGFMIEDDEAFEKRTGSEEFEKMVYSQDSCDAQALDVMSMFQYMIGNTDWYINTKHNIDVFEKKDGSLIPVPFDFDYAGVINTSYAKPSNEIPIKRVTQRYYKGSCREIEAYNPVTELFNSKKEEIFVLYNSFELLSKLTVKKSLKYYTKFYKILNNPDDAESSFHQACNSQVQISSFVKK